MIPSAAPARLARLEGCLLEDPGNLALLAATFEAALRHGDLARAWIHLQTGSSLAGHDPDWALRRAHWLLADGQLDAARAALQPLSEAADLPHARGLGLAHDLAYIALRQAQPQRARATLEPWIDKVSAARALEPGVQVLWLRVLHRAGDLPGGLRWAAARWSHGALAPAAAGVASLLALDAGDYARCDDWSACALAAHPHVPEAVVARASLDLARRDSASARAALERVLARNPEDGRAWSAMGLARLLAQDLDGARASFETATRLVPSHVGTWHGAAWAALMRRDLDGALQGFASALALDRNFAESHGGLAVVLALQGRTDPSRAAVERALRLDRASLSARYAQALLEGSGGDTASLRRLARRLLAGMPAPLGGSLADVVAGEAASSG